jgi:putative phosphoesterase
MHHRPRSRLDAGGYRERNVSAIDWVPRHPMRPTRVGTVGMMLEATRGIATKIAIVSDVHGNLTALDAVIADLDSAGPDLVIHGGDLALGGAQPAEVVDRIRELGWPGVLGNTDQVLWSFEGIPDGMPESVRTAIQTMGAATSAMLGEDRTAWLKTLPMEWKGNDIGLVHAIPGNVWPVIPADAEDAKLESTYGQLDTALAVYCHIHRPFVRRLSDFTVANSGSVGSPFDGDPRASYLLVVDGEPKIRRVEYDLDLEAEVLAKSGYPYAEATLASRRKAAPPTWQ